ncbi:primosomal protein N' [Marinisporobacter balticus]|uniref:Replication restart protein PriA n=1 Tax=Marinisporobacter balticus TaxID=2018667 RepID=A0A4R2L1C0_9FIRM|nr:primosomal protein N' [Marinisporobacter balticus]TCO78977.1 replication restart DNA helicase PriA [Marinisporobacter balticus]
MEKIKFVKVIINHKSNQTDRAYTYKIPEKLIGKIHIASRIIIPFGKGNRTIEGFVVDIVDHIDIDYEKVKYVKSMVEESDILSEELIDLCRWMKEKYLCKFIDAIQCVIPTGISLKSKKRIVLNKNFKEKELSSYRLSEKQGKIIKLLLDRSHVTEDFLKKYLQDSNINAVIKSLEDKNMIVVKNALKSDVNTAFEKKIRLLDKEDIRILINKVNKNAKKQREVLAYLLEHKEVLWGDIKEKMNVSLSTIQTLSDKGFVEMIEVEKRRDPYKNMDVLSTEALALTKEQTFTIQQIIPYIDKNTYKPFLIHGVTGSGKTEVYMQLIHYLFNQSKEAIVLVPEIALTSQMIERFKGRFGNNVAVLHSKLSLGERYDEWNRIKNGEVKIAVGARSAVFAPFKNLGMIIIDEEHEHTYKSDYSPKYHAIDVAKFRCIQNNGVLILGSATPSIESYQKSLNGEYHKIEMRSRFNNNSLPGMEIIDMRKELEKGNKSIFSACLHEGIMNNLKKGEQTILFLNRRGHSTFISCRKCGYVVKCPNCEISLTYHAASFDAVCHYCGYTKKPPKICPACESKYIKYFGVGTEKIEVMTKKYFPQAKVARLDLDTTSKKGEMDRTLDQFKKGKIDILIGTQMIAKGLDFPNVTLVGVIAADTNLNLPDFRANEKTFQLITQVAGRAGRGEILGNVVVQTYGPDHFVIDCAKDHDYKYFYQQEIMLRKEFFYPPYARLINILFTAENEAQLIKETHNFANMLRGKLLECKMNLREVLHGPHPAPLSKIKEKYRWQIIIKSNPVDQNTIKGIINDIRFDNRGNHFSKDINISIDIDPYSML